MNLTSFLKDLWEVVKDYRKVILMMTLISAVLLMGLFYFVRQVDQSNEDLVAENTAEQENYTQIGNIEIYQEENQEDFQLVPALPQEVIEEIHSWDTFRSYFSLHTSDPTVDRSLSLADYLEEDPSGNPLELFLGLDPKQRKNIRIHPDTERAYVTFEIDPENGNARMVNVQEGFNDFRIQLEVEDEEGTFASEIPDDTDDLVNFKIGMTPGDAQLGYLESVFDWEGGLDYPRMFGQKANFYITDPVPFTPIPALTSDASQNYQVIIMVTLISILIGLLISLIVAFLMALFNDTIKYSFAYGWAADDLFLQYDSNASGKQVAFDILQSDFSSIAVISQYELPDNLSQLIQSSSSKQVSLVEEISDLSLDEKIEEFVIVVQRDRTEKNWYNRQRKHLEAFRNKSVKVVELEN